MIVLCLAIGAVSSPAALGQERQDQIQEQQQPQRPQQRPTLGPHPPSSPHGPSSAGTTDIRKLSRVHTIYIDRIDNQLSEKLSENISKMGRFRIVTKRSEADAVLSGTCFDMRRLKAVRSEVYLNDRINGDALWQDSLRRSYNPPPLGKVVDDTAAEIVAHLDESLKEADRK